MHILPIAGVLLVCCLAVYWPGLQGPFLFDDYPNIVDNQFINNAESGFNALMQAAFSSESGPTGRPLAMFSFALNAVLGDGVSNPFSFKLTNTFIHWLNSLLVFLLCYQVATYQQTTSNPTATNIDHSRLYLAGAAALLWATNPMQLTSVLYVVQRMTSLSALFTLIALVSYLHGRQLVIKGQTNYFFLVVLPIFFWLLGMVSKENAILLPLFIVASELTLFRQQPLFESLVSRRSEYRQAIRLTSLVASALLVSALIWYFLPGYANRPFTMWERVLTEGRIVAFYLSLLLLPRINELGLFHDDIVISKSLVDPWTTLVSLLLLAVILFAAWRQRKRFPLASFGILFFFVGHSLESTIVPLELAHEHRNYLPSVGIALALLQVPVTLETRRKQIIVGTTFVFFLSLYAGTTYIRSQQWSDWRSLLIYETLHHPNSPRNQFQLSGMLDYLGKPDEAAQAALTAARLAPREAGYLVHLQLLRARHTEPDPALDKQIVSLLASQPQSAFLQGRLRDAIACLKSRCGNIAPSLETWLTTLIKHTGRGKTSSLYNYHLGETLYYTGRKDQAIPHLLRSADQDRRYAHPLFLLASIYLQGGQYDQAEKIRERIERLNRRRKLKWKKELDRFTSDLDQLRKHEQDSR